jgi:phospholipid/cholesterol/gamma-HCH transport system substrate-binding protein
MKKSFSERNPFTVGVIGLTALVAVLLAAFNIDDLPLIGHGPTYSAAFRDASGLVPGNEVRVAGVKVGSVRAVGLDRQGNTPYVRVTFSSDADLGDRTTATIRIKTVLGQKFLALEPSGSKPLEDQIPLDRTASPLDVVQALTGLADTAQRIDVAQLARSFTVLSETFADTPDAVRSSLTGLSRLSQTVASRDDQLRALLDHARTVTGVLAQRDEEFAKLVTDANLLLAEVQRRRDAIHQLLVATDLLSTQLSGLIADNRNQLGPALQRLRQVVETLRRNRTELESSIRNMAPFINAFTNVIGNGRWFDSWVDGLLQPYVPTVKR